VIDNDVSSEEQERPLDRESRNRLRKEKMEKNRGKEKEDNAVLSNIPQPKSDRHMDEEPSEWARRLKIGYRTKSPKEGLGWREIIVLIPMDWSQFDNISDRHSWAGEAHAQRVDLISFKYLSIIFWKVCYQTRIHWRLMKE
jgi:hypothetical protein